MKQNFSRTTQLGLLKCPEMFLRTLVVAALIAYVVAKEVPSYIKPCPLADPKFEECALESGNNAIAAIVKGDKSFKVVNHAPLLLPEVVLQATAGLLMKLNAVEINFDGAKLTAFKLDPKKKILELILLQDFFFKGQYDVNGRILVLPFSGNGSFNASMEQEKIEYSSTYELVKKGGKDYIKILTDDVKSSNKHATFYFDNLFGGDKQLGAQINKALGENWKEFQEEFRPAVKKIWTTIVHGALTAYLGTIPFNELFP